jgi:hypothetical protein
MYSVLSEEAKAAFLKSRETLKWGSYGKEGGQPRQDILVKDLSDLHIENILTTQHHISGTYIEVVFLTEVEYRKIKGITVKD